MKRSNKVSPVVEGDVEKEPAPEEEEMNRGTTGESLSLRTKSSVNCFCLLYLSRRIKMRSLYTVVLLFSLNSLW